MKRLLRESPANKDSLLCYEYHVSNSLRLHIHPPKFCFLTVVTDDCHANSILVGHVAVHCKWLQSSLAIWINRVIALFYSKIEILQFAAGFWRKHRVGVCQSNEFIIFSMKTVDTYSITQRVTSPLLLLN